MKANYEEDKVIVSATEPTGVNRKKVWFKKGKNLFNKNNVISNVNLLANGSIESDTLSSIHYIEVVGGQIYSLSSNVDRQWVFNTSAEKLSSSTQGSQRTVTSGTSVQINVPSGHKYINIRHYSNLEEDNINQDIQLEQNPVVTTYEQYIEPEIYILNSNSVYEKFEKDECKEITLFDGSCTFGNKNICNVPDSIKNIDVYFMCKTATNEINKGIIKVDTSTTRTINETFGMLVACGGTIFAEVEMVFKPNRTIVADYCAIYRNLNSSAEEKKENSDYIVYKVVGYK